MPDKPVEHSPFPGIIRMAKTLPQSAAEVVKGKYACWKASQQLIKHRHSLGWKEAAAQSVRDQLERMIRDRGRLRESSLYKEDISSQLASHEESIVREIQASTAEANRSNITRTRAYLDCYEQHPELQWAFLAHMVSRNAGWNMSDIKGGLMEDLMDPKFRTDLYRMLERSNALIFQDAYPQLLLYAHSRKLGRSLFHLLPEFDVSTFMLPFWEKFWIERDSALLAVGLIINEQNYIEGRVVQNGYFQKHVLKSPQFLLHNKFQMNQIIFPMYVRMRDIPGCSGEQPESTALSSERDRPPCKGMVGLILENFSNLHERIEFGKALFAMLFGYSDVLTGVQAYASAVTHQGSRNEYWPKMFTCDKQKALNSPKESTELMKQEWLPEGKRIYSPSLNDVWQDVPYEPIQRYDWFKDQSMVRHITRPKRPIFIEMTHAHRFALQKTALTHDAEKALS